MLYNVAAALWGWNATLVLNFTVFTTRLCGHLRDDCYSLLCFLRSILCSPYHSLVVKPTCQGFLTCVHIVRSQPYSHCTPQCLHVHTKIQRQLHKKILACAGAYYRKGFCFINHRCCSFSVSCAVDLFCLSLGFSTVWKNYLQWLSTVFDVYVELSNYFFCASFWCCWWSIDVAYVVFLLDLLLCLLRGV